MWKVVLCSLLLQCVLQPALSVADCPIRLKCGSKYEPVCGSDGNTYNNTCQMNSFTCFRVKALYNGTCEGSATTEHTADLEPCDENVMCPMIYAPVCGADDVTYGNDCVMRSRTCGRVELAYRGACKDSTTTEPTTDAPCINNRRCAMIYEPVCGTDNKTYSNQCVLQGETCDRVQVAYNGSCQAPAVEPTTDIQPCINNRGCPRIYAPVCGADGVTYSNECVFNSTTCGAVGLAHYGECVATATSEPATKPCSEDYICTMEYRPVCGDDGQTYPNVCVLNSSTCGSVGLAHYGECQATTTSEPATEPCSGDYFCTMEYRPVCGDDGQTYPNVCVLNSSTCGSVGLAHYGECQATATSDPTADLEPCSGYSLCTMEYEPVCGADGQTYSNECVFTSSTCGRVGLAHYGRC